jgi:isoquinoline 1-oxidoreductase subunit alpha
MIALNINGRSVQVDASPDMPLLWALRDELKLSGTKYGCGVGVCGACTVHIDGNAVRACATPVSDAAKGQITTIEGVGMDAIGKAVQDAWIKQDVAQCGYCQSGQIMQATALLRTNKRPTDADIDTAMNDNICRCGTYVRIRAAIKDAAKAIG